MSAATTIKDLTSYQCPPQTSEKRESKYPFRECGAASTIQWTGQNWKHSTFPSCSRQAKSKIWLRMCSALSQIMATTIISVLGISLTASEFFYVKNHGLSEKDVKHQYAIAQAFFDLDLEEKEKYLANTAAGDFRGYRAQSKGELEGRDNDEQYNISKNIRQTRKAQYSH
jgi:hypothetical protein